MILAPSSCEFDNLPANAISVTALQFMLDGKDAAAKIVEVTLGPGQLLSPHHRLKPALIMSSKPASRGGSALHVLFGWTRFER
jgi:hypothetical protein